MNLEDLYRLLRSSHVQAQGVMDTIDEPLVVLDERGCVLEANRAFFGTFRVERDDTIGSTLIALGNGQWNVPELTRLIGDIIPRATAVIDYEVTHQFPHIGTRTFLLTARRLWKPDNNSTQVLLVFNDVTASRARERENSLLFSELRHRMTNLLGIVRALANQTDTQGRTADEYKAAFLGRFEAVLKAQSLLAGGGTAVGLSDLVASVVGGLGGARLQVSGGPPVLVGEKQVVPLTIILHELGTNALKHGAFSRDAGLVHLAWTVLGEGETRSLRLTWDETGVPAASRRGQTGTGTGIIQSSAKLGLQGSVELDFRSDGLVVALVMPLTEDHG